MATGVTTQQQEQIKALLAEGLTTNAISKRVGLTWRRVKETINDLDLVVEEGNAGRRPKYDDKAIEELLVKFKDYIDRSDIPIIAEFAYQNGCGKQFFYDRPEFSDLLKICLAKKESALETGALKGVLNPTMAVFSLKQMGWTDRQQVEATNTNHNMNTDVSKLSPEERRARIDELNRRRGTGIN